MKTFNNQFQLSKQNVLVLVLLEPLASCLSVSALLE
ncbi:hypothetical protein Pla144_30970 [Bythopirellula polymerisocia]|uniref:Uncharacterized protein n=1 Tax=Bythopirellula polymerisocia TaxID=2528003 RepID=A0A5C6CQR3_9BACT|nr:hypothetical protein Pla144_30970 [Bythopirellula polymerisocia]